MRLVHGCESDAKDMASRGSDGGKRQEARGKIQPAKLICLEGCMTLSRVYHAPRYAADVTGLACLIFIA